jgi:hypothetical protein
MSSKDGPRAPAASAPWDVDRARRFLGRYARSLGSTAAEIRLHADFAAQGPEQMVDFLGHIGLREAIAETLAEAQARSCRICGCTDNDACEGGCHWIGPDLCSTCEDKAAELEAMARAEPDGGAIPCEIGLFVHCAQCIRERPPGISPADWMALELGWTEIGLQVWCRRHQRNVMHIDFEDAQHPAQTDGGPGLADARLGGLPHPAHGNSGWRNAEADPPPRGSRVLVWAEVEEFDRPAELRWTPGLYAGPGWVLPEILVPCRFTVLEWCDPVRPADRLRLPAGEGAAG